MSRIRTVKPELFKHESLFEAEMTTKLPLRLAFIGLLTCCDREGRFKWRPQRLKLDMLPYDNIDITQILDALAKYEFITKYEVKGKFYGFIPSFTRHQQINNREIESDIPAPVESIVITNNNLANTEVKNTIDASVTRASRVEHASELCTCMHQGNMEYGIGNMEGNREYGIRNMNVVASLTRYHDLDPPIQKIFKHWQTVMKHPDAKLDNKRKILIKNALGLGYSVEQLFHAITGCSVTPHNIGNNPQGQRYDGLHIIFKDADQIDRFIQHHNNPPKPISDVEKRNQSNVNAVQRWINKKMQEEVEHAK